MKFKIGDKVKYDSGDWWFYGAVSAVFEHPICPCYRLDIERMEKKDCKLSITQFEFELEAETILEREMDIPKLESAEIDHLKKDDKVRNYGHLSTLLERNLQALERMYQPVKSEPIPVRIDRPVPEGIQETITEPEKVNLLQKPTEKPLTRKAGEAWERCFDNFRKGVKSHSVNTWVYQNRRQYQAGLLSEEKIAKLIASKFVFESSRKKDKSQQKPDNEDETAIPKRGENWERNLEMYQKGVRNNTIFTWISQNRNQYRTGKLADDKFDKLIKINFPFESTRSKLQDWDKNFEKWIQGERDSLTQWKDRNIKLYNTGKLEKEKIEKLREVGILK